MLLSVIKVNFCQLFSFYVVMLFEQRKKGFCLVQNRRGMKRCFKATGGRSQYAFADM